VPARFWSFAERCVELAPPPNPNAKLSAIATALVRPVVIFPHRHDVIAERAVAPLTAPIGGSLSRVYSR
jgi:hypothetical protein